MLRSAKRSSSPGHPSGRPPGYFIERILPAAGIALAGLVWFAAQPRTQGIQFTTLPGFAIERVVPVAKTDSYVAMTFDSQGRLFVSKEFEPPRWLLDNDGDGTFESEKVFSDKVKNCQGLWWDARTLYANCAPGDEPMGQGGGGAPGRSGLYRMEDTNGDDVADTFEQVTGYVGGIQEHGPHAVRRGPDGEMTVITGNNTFVPDDKIDPRSPLGGHESQFLPALPDGRGFGPSVKEGRHGVVSRYDRQRKHFTLMVGGLRNSYDYAFNLAGELFLFDSDMEWDINMPWYRDVRTVHGIPGGNYGYRNGSGKFPPYYIDSLPAVRDLGRGSPVGVEFYQHNVYPKQFRDAYFEADWSRGRLLWTALVPNGATYKAVEAKTEFVHGEPLNITDVETGPDGLIYFSTGGRGTEGGLYRVRYTGAGAGSAATQADASKPAGVLAIVRQPQPLSSWGFAAIEKAKTTMGAAFVGELEKLARDGAADGIDRAQAVYILQRHGSAPSSDLLKALIVDKNADVRAAVVYVAGVQGVDAQGGGEAKAVAIAALKDAHPLVQRRAAEALVRMGMSVDKPGFVPAADLYALLNSPDRFVRYAGRLALERTPRAEWQDKAAAEMNVFGAIEGGVALIETATADEQLLPVFKTQLGLASKAGVSVDDKLRAIRALQLATIGMKTVPPELRSQVHTALIGQFPSREERLNRQLALTLAWSGQPAAIAKILAAMPAGDTNQQLQLHYVSALRTMKDGWTHAQKEQLMDWYAKAITWRGGASFPGFINLLFDASLQTFTPEEKTLAYKKVPQFAPLTEEEITAAAQRQAAQRAANQPQAAGAGGAGQTAANRPPQPPPPAGPQRQAPPASARSRGTMAISREELAQELIFTPQRQPPSAEVGQQIFEKTCSACHRFGSLGKDIGPDLTTLNSRFQKKDIVDSILWPSKVISDQYDVTMVETKDGKSLAGFVVREEGGKLIMRTADEMGRSFEVPSAQVKSRTKSPVSMMPEGLVDEFTVQQIAGLLKFLQAAPPPASR